MAEVLASNPNKQVLMLVPTIMLVDQQASSLEQDVGVAVGRYSAGRPVPDRAARIVVSTPAAFCHLRAEHSDRFGLHLFGLVVFDEVHHVVKAHPYRKIARYLDLLEGNMRPTILGLTASLTYAVESRQMEKSIRDLCAELHISKVASATLDELIQGGYHGHVGQAVSIADSGSREDRTLTKQWSPPACPKEFKVHENREEFFYHVQTGIAHPLAIALVGCARGLEQLCIDSGLRFESPMMASGKRGRVAEWGAYAHDLAAKQTSPGLRGTLAVLEDVYEAVRIMINSRQADAEMALSFLEMMGTRDRAIPPPAQAILDTFEDDCDAFFEVYAPSHRFDRLKEELLAQAQERGADFRGIVFVQQRVTSHIVQYLIAEDPELAATFRSAVVYATSSPATASLKISPSQSKANFDNFRNGTFNLIVSTSVSEEGMDVPEANVVMRFDPIQTPVSLVQSRGRARQAGSSFVVLAESSDARRSAAALQQAELNQKDMLAHPQFQALDQAALRQGREVAQANRLRSALAKLKAQADRGAPPYSQLTVFSATAKAMVEERFTAEGKGWACHLTLLLPDADPMAGTGAGATKVVAKAAAAEELLVRIRSLSV